MSQCMIRPLHCTDYCGHSIWARAWQGHYTVLTTVVNPYEPEQDKAITLHWLLWAFHMSQGMTRPLHYTDYCGHSIWARAGQDHYTALTTVGIPYEPVHDKAITLHWLLWAFHMSQGMTRPLHCTDYCGHSIWARAGQGHYTALTTVVIPYEPGHDKAITLHWLLWAFHMSQSRTRPFHCTDYCGHSIWARAGQGHYTAMTTVGIPYEPEQDKAITLHWLLWAFHMSQGMTRPLHYTDYCWHSIWARAWQGHYTALTTVGIPYEPGHDKAITLHWLLWAFHMNQGMTRTLHCTDYCRHSIWARAGQGHYTALTTVGIPYEPGHDKAVTLHWLLWAFHMNQGMTRPLHCTDYCGHSIWARAGQGHYTALTTVGIPYEPGHDKAITLHWLLWAFHMSQGMTRPLHCTDYCGHSIWARAGQGHYTALTTVGIPYKPEHDKTNKRTCVPREDRSVWAFAQSVQSLCCPSEESSGP